MQVAAGMGTPYPSTNRVKLLQVIAASNNKNRHRLLQLEAGTNSRTQVRLLQEIAGNFTVKNRTELWRLIAGTFMTNPRKLSLPVASPAGKQVRVSDGFYYGGKFYAPVTSQLWRVPSAVGGNKQVSWTDENGVMPVGVVSNVWVLIDDAPTVIAYVDGTTGSESPWDLTGWKDPADGSTLGSQPALTHPAHQQLAAPGVDAMVVTGPGAGTYTKRGIYVGKPYYNLLGEASNTTQSAIYWKASDTAWKIADLTGFVLEQSTAQDTATPDLATWPTDTVTYLRYQPQGGVFVAGGTQDGVYSKRANFTGSGKDDFVLLGLPDSQQGNIEWVSFFESTGTGGYNGSAFIFRDAGSNPLYYSASNVATPDLASNWKNDADDTPASITVTSLTQGDLAAGFKIDSVTYQLNGNQNGRGKYSDVLSVADSVVWDGLGWKYYNGAEWGSDINIGNVAFPWQGTPEVSITKSNPAAEANWAAA